MPPPGRLAEALQADALQVERAAEAEAPAPGISKLVHELNNFLGVIKLSHALLEVGVTDPTQVTHLTMIGHATEWAIALAGEVRSSAP